MGTAAASSKNMGSAAIEKKTTGLRNIIFEAARKSYFLCIIDSEASIIAGEVPNLLYKSNVLCDLVFFFRIVTFLDRNIFFV